VSTALKPELAADQSCVTDPVLAGSWTDFRMTQLGPAWTRFTFNCDCTFESRVQLLWMRIRERGRYQAHEGQLRFQRPSRETRWSYRFDGAKLELQEAPGERQRYARAQQLSCSQAGPAGPRDGLGGGWPPAR